MTDEAKALVGRLRSVDISWSETGEWCAEAADLIETQAREIERLRAAHCEMFEEWAGSEGFIPETAPEGYLLQLTKRMADIASAALAGDSHD